MESILKKISEICEGFINWTFPTEEIKKVAEERLNICLTCPFRSDIEKSSNQIKITSVCISCGCNLKVKTSCLNCKCPKEKWKEHENRT